MKMHIYGCEPSRSERNLRVLGGGYDAKAGRAVLIVQDDDGFPGTLHFDVTEAREAAERLTKELPAVTRVEVAEGNGKANGDARKYPNDPSVREP